MTRLAWGLILCISIIAPDLAAKAKRSKSSSASSSAKSSKETSNAVSFTIARPENAGMMNGIPSRIVVEPRDGILSSRLTHLGLDPKGPPKDKERIVLVGGDTVELSVKPGKYSVQVITPVENQPPAGYMAGKRRAWESPVVKVLLERGEAIILVVEPGVTGADYNGSWQIAKAAPPEAEPQGGDAASEQAQ